LAEKVGYIQYVLLKITPSGSAYQPGKRGLPDVDLLVCARDIKIVPIKKNKANALFNIPLTVMN
jgi:hypothetical protein